MNVNGGQREMDDRIFGLLGARLSAPQMTAIVSREFGLADDEAFDRIIKVLRERGTPQGAKTRAIAAELAAMRF